jgi:RNA polymerase sigma-70 factor (ECF subfamily)
MEQQHTWFCAQVEKHKAALYRLTRSILRSDEDAKDAVSEAVCKAFAKLDSLRQPERFQSWIMRIAANEAYTILYRRQRLVSLEDYDREPPAPDRPDPDEHGLWPLVQSLPGSLRAPVVLFYYDQLSVREIADILSLTEGAVKTRLSRGRQRLKEMLEKEGQA